jgi:hypothetical protein
MLSHPRRSCGRRPALTALLGASFLAAALAASSSPPPTVPGKTPPAAGLDPELAKRLPELSALVEEYRGLRFARPVATRTSSETDLSKLIAAGLRIDSVPAREDAGRLEVSLAAFGLIPRAFDLASYLPKLMGSQIAGFYDSRKKELALVTGPHSLVGTAGATRSGPFPNAKGQEGLLVHELTHALQNQHFDLSRLAAGDPLSDPDAARRALVEGDASLVMLADLGAMRPDDVPKLSAFLQKLLDDPQQLAAISAAAPGMAELQAAPAWIRETLLFSYLRGASFCADVLGHGGQRLLDYAFRSDPPRSTAQILHPEKWYGQRDDPDVIAWPDLAAQLPGYGKAAEGQLGELGVRILLQEGLHDPRRGAVDAAGWRGDRFAVYRKTMPTPPPPPEAPGSGTAGNGDHGGGAEAAGERDRQARPALLLAWITDWDTSADAARFAAAVTALGADWLVEPAAGNRVVIVRGMAAGAEHARLTAALAGAQTDPPANRAIDPAAVDPQRQIGAPGKIVAARVAAGVFAQLDQPAIESRLGEDGRTYSFPAIGLTLRLPTAMAGWRSMPPGSPAILLDVSAPRRSAFLQVAVIDLHQEGVSLAMLQYFVEEGMKSSIPGFAKVSGRTLDLGGVQGYELRFTAAGNGTGNGKGNEGLGTGRIYLRGTRYLSIMTFARSELWAELEPSVTELFDSVALAPAPGPPAAGPPPR